MDVATPLTPEVVLSNNVKSSQLLAPGHLERITISQQHYKTYKDKQALATSSSGEEPVLGKVKRYGDKYFFLHKNLPVEQNYQLTSMKLSSTRPWDGIVGPPLRSNEVVSKEIVLPFPQEHPYASHISHYTTFPDPVPHPPAYLEPPSYLSSPSVQPSTPIQKATLTTEDAQTANEVEEGDSGTPINKVKAHAYTQTPVVDRPPCNPPAPYTVSRKAYDHGIRVEHKQIGRSTTVPTGTVPGEMLWNWPRSHPHKRACTYPAPSQLYSRPATTPLHIPPPSTAPTGYVFPWQPPHIMQAMNNFHSLFSRTTSYKDHFPTPPRSPGSYTFHIDHTQRSRGCMRPWTSESRGKYSSQAVDTSTYSSSVPSRRTAREIGKVARKDASCYVDFPEKRFVESDDLYQVEMENENGDVIHAVTKKVETFDVETQTDFPFDDDDYEESAILHKVEEEEKLPQISAESKYAANASKSVLIKSPTERLAARLYNLPLLPAQPSLSPAAMPSQGTVYTPTFTTPGNSTTTPAKYAQRTTHGYTPSSTATNAATAEAMAKLETVRAKLQSSNAIRKWIKTRDSYSRTESLRAFHQMYPSESPDLRKINMLTRKKNTFSGFHSYYFH